MPLPVKEFFSSEEKKIITEAIQAAEKQTSGEIRVHIENRTHGSVMDRAAFWFEKLNMQKTDQRNGVLFYLAIGDKQFAILGDVGINKAVPKGFWDDIKLKMESLFREGEFTEGLKEGILEAGNQLKQHFPWQTDDINELNDEISFGKN